MALVGWTALGLLGIGISWIRQRRGVAGEREKMVGAVGWVVGVWVVYLVVLVVVSLRSPLRVVEMGQDRCLGEMCFAVIKVEELPQFVDRNQVADGSRLLRVSIRVRNKARGKAESEALMRAYLVDGQGRRWEEVAGLSGNRLSTRVAAGGEIVSEPVFKVAADASGLGLVFTEGRWQPGVLVVGGSDSLFHKRTEVRLGR